MTHVPTDRPARPRPDSVRLKPEFIRSEHLGPVSAPQARAFIGNIAELTWLTSTSPKARRAAIGRAVA